MDERTHLKRQISQLRELIAAMENDEPASLTPATLHEMLDRKLDDSEPIHPHVIACSEHVGPGLVEELRTGLKRLENDLADLEHEGPGFSHPSKHELAHSDASPECGECTSEMELKGDDDSIEVRDYGQRSLSEFTSPSDSASGTDSRPSTESSKKTLDYRTD